MTTAIWQPSRKVVPAGTYNLWLRSIDHREVNTSDGAKDYLVFVFGDDDEHEITFSCNNYLTPESKFGIFLQWLNFQPVMGEPVDCNELLGMPFRVRVVVNTKTTKDGKEIEVNDITRVERIEQIPEKKPVAVEKQPVKPAIEELSPEEAAVAGGA
jgi:hypothetical protein